MHQIFTLSWHIPCIRLKMGVREGYPGCIQPDHLGRADYNGACVNEAARFMDAGGGRGRML